MEEKQANLVQQCESLLSLINGKLPDAFYKNTLVDLLSDVKQDEHYITVLGEFKRGKSTLLNALIKDSLLPSDVTPTTATINVLKHNYENGIDIFMQNGDIKGHALSPETLQNYTFETGEELQDVHHIDIHLDLDHLHEKAVLVDTPGVGDLNEHRLDVTYSYIPRSNLVIFVFDATTPIRKTELDYLQDTVLKLKFGEIIFVANFIDRLDEEEMEETMDYMETRLKKVMKEESFTIFPISSREAIKDPHNPDFEKLEKYIKHQLTQGEASKEKLSFYESRFNHIYNMVEEEIETIEQIRKSSDEELANAYAQLEAFKKEQEKNKETLRRYIAERKEEIIALTSKSIDHFEEGLIEDVHEAIQLYEGPKFKSFIEKNIPALMKKRLKNWVNSYSPQIEKLIRKLEQEMIDGFNQLFSQEIGTLRMNYSANRLEGKGFTVHTKSGSSDTTVTSGMIAGGAGAIMVLLSGGLLFPIITMAGFPFLNKVLAEKRLEKLKAEVTPHVDTEMEKVIGKLKESTKQYIVDEIIHLEEKALIRYEEHMKVFERTLEMEMQRRKKDQVSELPIIEMNELLLIKQ
jgi:GTPase SAR1 family protein